jgi:MFS family permease
MRVVLRFFAWFVGAVIGTAVSSIALEIFTGKHDPFIQAIFGMICGSLGWMLVGKSKSSDE